MTPTGAPVATWYSTRLKMRWFWRSTRTSQTDSHHPEDIDPSWLLERAAQGPTGARASGETLGLTIADDGKCLVMVCAIMHAMSHRIIPRGGSEV